MVIHACKHANCYAIIAHNLIETGKTCPTCRSPITARFQIYIEKDFNLLFFFIVKIQLKIHYFLLL